MIKENLAQIKSQIPNDVTLVVVSKTHPNSVILKAYDEGERIFGENKVQELITKYETLPKDIQWHMIGHLQSNKIKYIVPFISLIHGVHKFKLLKEINKQAQKTNRIVDVLLQFHIAEEDTKTGLTFEEAQEMLESIAFSQLKHVRICGVMGMATFTDDEKQIRTEFNTLSNYFRILKDQHFSFNEDFKIISMGMSGDFKIAIEEGSTMIRVGSKIFGHRNYTNKK